MVFSFYEVVRADGIRVVGLFTNSAYALSYAGQKP